MRALAPHWGALLALALFLIVGLAILDDYGESIDEPTQRRIARVNLDYLANGGIERFLTELRTDSDKFYGVALEAPMFLAERAFGLNDPRGVRALRHLLTHLCYLAGGLFAYLLARRLFRNRALAAVAMLIFLLHPRLYAHSFFNSKDIPFLAMFVIALFLAHRAFRRDRVGAFALLGAAVGVLVNLRIMGVVLLAAIPALRALDFAFAEGWAERKRAILTMGAFALTAALSVYALLPYLWADPLGRAVEWWATLSNHPTIVDELFRGTLYRSDEFPADYVPTWFSITSPPFALALGLVGAAAVLVRQPGLPPAAIRSGSPRFGLLLIGCAATPAAAVILLDANVINGWRHVYFLWAPFSLLAALGLAWAASAFRRARLRAAVYGAAGAGIAATLISMTLIHPSQQVYFNFLVDRVTPEYLRTQYVMDYWKLSVWQAREWISQRMPPPERIAHKTKANTGGLPEEERARLTPASDLVLHRGEDSWSRSERPLHRVKVYGNTLMTIEMKDDFRAVYEATLSREPILDAAFDVYRLDDAVALVMEPCAPFFLDDAYIFLRAIPVDADDLPPWREGKRFEALNYVPQADRGALFDGKCVVAFPLPGYPVADIEVEWSPPLLDDNEAREAMRQAKADGRLLARSFYDVYLAAGELVYVKENCDPLETEHTFSLNIHPQRADDLPEEWRERGSERIRFGFIRNGAFVGDACVALLPLPDYPVAGFRTGQRIGGAGGNLWRASFSSNPEPYRAVYRAAASSEPAARSVFDVHLTDGALVYVKEPCEQTDTEARFFLHVVPERVSDLPEDRREYGFNGLDFDFFLNGAWFDGKCAARVALPDYPVVSVRTGQHISGVRETWGVELATPGR